METAPVELDLSPLVSVGGEALVIVGYFDHHTGQVTPAASAPPVTKRSSLPRTATREIPAVPQPRVPPAAPRRPASRWRWAVAPALIVCAALPLFQPRRRPAAAVTQQPPPAAAPLPLPAPVVPPAPSFAPPVRAEEALAEDPPPGEGPRFAVRGVIPPDVLNLRAEPAAWAPARGTIPAGARDVRGTGRRRRVGPSVWREVVHDGHRGWVNARFLVRAR